MGYIAPEFFRWPGSCALDGPAFGSIPNGLKALGEVSGAGWGQMFLFCGFLELYAAKQDPTDPPGKLSGAEAGFGKSYFGALGVFKGDGIEDPEKKKRSLNAELANGRLAMMAFPAPPGATGLPTLSRRCAPLRAILAERWLLD